MSLVYEPNTDNHRDQQVERTRGSNEAEKLNPEPPERKRAYYPRQHIAPPGMCLENILGRSGHVLPHAAGFPTTGKVRAPRSNSPDDHQGERRMTEPQARGNKTGNEVNYDPEKNQRHCEMIDERMRLQRLERIDD